MSKKLRHQPGDYLDARDPSFLPHGIQQHQIAAADDPYRATSALARRDKPARAGLARLVHDFLSNPKLD